METTLEFTLLFRIPMTHPTADRRATIHTQWQNFISSIAARSQLVAVSRLGFEGAVVTPTETTENKIIFDNQLAISGFLTLKAANMDEAIATARLCPILLGGGTVEVRPALPMN